MRDETRRDKIRNEIRGQMVCLIPGTQLNEVELIGVGGEGGPSPENNTYIINGIGDMNDNTQGNTYIICHASAWKSSSYLGLTFQGYLILMAPS